MDAQNLLSDAPLVVIQQEEDDESDDDEGPNDNYPADPKLRKTHTRNVAFGMKCEWVGCENKVSVVLILSILLVCDVSLHPFFLWSVRCSVMFPPCVGQRVHRFSV